jgi:lysophospholipase L1-like esterase
MQIMQCRLAIFLWMASTLLIQPGIAQKMTPAAGNNTSITAFDSSGYKWWDPAGNNFPVLEGQAWPAEVKAPYDRFPARAEASLNPNVWNLSHSSAGLYLKFKSNSGHIVVRYTVKGVKQALAMPHMPATGVSGIDLYSIDQDGNWGWAPGKFSFGDTVEYRYDALEPNAAYHGKNFEYRLFLPLYNAVSWLEIGVPREAGFTPMPLQPEKPIVVYGTSIAQGACASRPGMAWTSILERELDRPLINLGFSGNGQLENSVIDLLTEIDAKIYVLDCLPNLTAGSGFSAEEVEKRIVSSVKRIQQRRPGVPILLTEHSGGSTVRIIDTSRYNNFEGVNKTLRFVFPRLQAEGIKNIFLLTNKEIGLGIDATVDGLHPNDIGMENYAAAYEKAIRTILKEPKGAASTTMPVVQSREGNYYDWRGRHREILSLNRSEPPGIVILGNSIIHYWGGQPKAPVSRGEDSWNQYLEPAGVRNQAFGWDRIENTLWRVYHDELDGYKARQIIVMIGTNNLGTDSDEAILAGLQQLAFAVSQRQPSADIVLSGILPRRQLEKRIAGLNKAIARLAARMKLTYINPGPVLLEKEGKIDESLFGDGLHPNAVGYRKLALALAPYLKK